MKKYFYIFLFSLLLTKGLWAHHIMGIPHYAYDESYPQAPVLKLVEQVGEWEFQLTGYPGNPSPGQRTELHVYVVNKKTRALFDKTLILEIFRPSLWGTQKKIYSSDEATLEENLFKFFPTYPETGQFEISITFLDGEIESTLRFPLVVGKASSPWKTVAGIVGGLALFIIIVRAFRIKRNRKLNRTSKKLNYADTSS